MAEHLERDATRRTAVVTVTSPWNDPMGWRRGMVRVGVTSRSVRSSVELAKIRAHARKVHRGAA
jgi:hypothetical protein